MSIDGVIFDMKIELDSRCRMRGNAMRRKDVLEVAILNAMIEDVTHWLKLVEKIERDGGEK